MGFAELLREPRRQVTVRDDGPVGQSPTAGLGRVEDLIERVQRQPPLPPVPHRVGDLAPLPAPPDLRGRRGVGIGDDIGVGINNRGVVPDFGMNNRQLSAADAESVTACTLTPIWQLPTLPSAPEYIRATPGESEPSLGKPTSSIANASGPIAFSVHCATRRRTST